MKHDQLIQAAYFACLAIGVDPTVRNVSRATAKIRSVAGTEKPVWGEHIRLWLKRKIENDTQTIPSRCADDTSVVFNKKENDTTATSSRYPRASVVKELELEIIEPNTTYLSPAASQQQGLLDTPSGSGDGSKTKPEAKPKPSTPAKPRHEPSAEDFAAYAIMDAAWPVISEHVKLGYGVTAWKQRNKVAALGLHEAGLAPQDVVDLLIVAYTFPDSKPFYDKVSQLGKLAEWRPYLTEIGERGPDYDSNNPDQPDVYEHNGRADLDRFLGPEQPVGAGA